jgi:isoquinoline 1-oxidoreductase alpha subunit
MKFQLNGHTQEVEVEPDMPLLWVLRDVLNLTGTKYGCGKGLCGACTVHIDSVPIRSCSVPVSAAEGRQVATIEGLGGNHAVQRAWHEENVVQCGYCQPGQIMSAVALLAQNPSPDENAVNLAMAGNICRCGTYGRVRKAITRAAEMMRNEA